MNKLWMRVTRDIFQLPLAVADTAQELARLCGTTTAVIYSQVSQVRSGRLKSCPWVCVHLDEDDEDGVA